MADVIAQATALGFDTTADAHLPIDPTAVRMLPREAPAVAVSVAAGVLAVVLDHVPTAAEVTALERVSGCSVTVTVTTPGVMSKLRERAHTEDVGATHTLAALLAGLGSDVHSVHLAAGAPPAVRVNQQIRPVDGWPVLSGKDLVEANRFIHGTTNPNTSQHGERGEHQSVSDVVVSWAGTRWRATTFVVEAVPQLVLRRIPAAPARLESLGLPASVAQTTDLNGGLVLLASGSGHGRTTTLNALLDRINSTRRTSIFTVEAPVEQMLTARQSTVTQRSVGNGPQADSPTLSHAVTVARHAGADVIAVSAPLVSRADLDAVLGAASAGRLVYLTVPAATTRAALASVLALAGDNDRAGVAGLLSEVLAAAVAQQLLVTADGALVPAVEVAWAHPALTTVIRENRMAQFDAVVDADPTGRSITMRRATSQLLASGQLSSEQQQAVRAQFPPLTAALTTLAAHANTTRSSAAATSSLTDAASPAAGPGAGRSRRAGGGRFAKSRFARAAAPADRMTGSAAATSAPTRRSGSVAAAAPAAAVNRATVEGAAHAARGQRPSAPAGGAGAVGVRELDLSSRRPATPPPSGTGITIDRQD